MASRIFAMRLNEVLPASLPKSLIPYLLSVLTVRTVLVYWCVVTPLHIIINNPLEFKPFLCIFLFNFVLEKCRKISRENGIISEVF